jgi:hypothetical protein
MRCIICGGGGSDDGVYSFCRDDDDDDDDVSCAIYGGAIEYASSFSLRLAG